MATSNEGRRLGDLTARYLNEGVRLWDRYLRALGQGSERLSVSSVTDTSRRMADFARNEGGGFVSQWVHLNIDYASSLLDLGVELSSRVLDTMLDQRTGEAVRVEPTATKRPGFVTVVPEPARPAPPQRTLLLRGGPGSRPTVQFKVSNQREQERVDVSFEISEFVSEDGRPAVRGDVEVVPATFVLQHGEERTVSCSIPLPQRFEADTRYMGLLRIIGFDDLSIGLVVELAPSPADAPKVEEPAPDASDTKA